MKASATERDYLWLNIRDLPYFRGLLRAVEARFYQNYDMPGPILDVGCGDGQFASVTFDKLIDVGIDPWSGPVRLAAKQGAYKLVIHGSGSDLPFDDQHFSTAISNSVLEHIPEVEKVLVEVARVMKPGGKFIFCVPNQYFLPNLSVSNFLDKIGLHGLANSYRRFFNRISRHHHCDSEEVWKDRLDKAGFEVERWWHYFSPRSFHVLEWGHYFGLPSLITHFLFRKWILVPTKWNLALTTWITKSCYDETPEHPEGSYSFYIARRKS